MQRWGHDVTPADQWRRFDRVASDAAAAQRQLARLDAAHRQAARRPCWRCATTIRVPRPWSPPCRPALRTDPALMLAEAARLRRTGRLGDAAQLWAERRRCRRASRRSGTAARLLGRARCRWRAICWRPAMPASAYTLAATAGRIAPRQALDADFLAGWIALRWLHDPDARRAAFRRPRRGDRRRRSPRRGRITGSPAARAARADAAAARAGVRHRRRAGPPPITASSRHSPSATIRRPSMRASPPCATPPWTAAQALAFSAREDARAAACWLPGVSRGAHGRSCSSSRRMRPAEPGRRWRRGWHSASGCPTRRWRSRGSAGVGGLVLADAGWPTTVVPPGPVEPAVILGLIRQESSFDTAAAQRGRARAG